jgi:hypothetical protein
MQNFGRGMWRRVGDFERIQVPQIIKETQIQQALLNKEYISQLQRQKEIQEYRKKMLEKVNLPIVNELESNQTNIEFLKKEITEETPIEIIELEPEIPIQKEEKRIPTIISINGNKKKQ